MNTENTHVTDGDVDQATPRTDAQIESSIQAKIDAAVEAAATSGQVDPSKQIGVFVGADGSIDVRNISQDEIPTQEPGIPDPVEFPAMYADDSRESLTDSHYKEHLESHWGF